MRGKDVIMFGLQPWDIPIGSNFRNIAMEIAKHNRVMYVNQPADRISLIRYRNDHRIKNRKAAIKKGKSEITEVQDNLFVLNPGTILESINWIGWKSLYENLSFVNSRRLAKTIKEAASELGFENPVLIIDNDFLRGYHLPEMIDHELFIFYIRDYLLSQTYFKKHGSRLEPLMIAKADVVACNSTYLAHYAKKYNPNSFDIGQGCELDAFTAGDYEKPDELKKLHGPMIGYCGALLSARLDIDLLKKIAEVRPDWNIVLVGPEDDVFKKSALHNFSNVIFTGNKKLDELPAYIHHFDVCINPQVLNQMTVGNYPRKVDEYLAAGKPVVATETIAMEMFRGFTYLAKNFKDYIVKIEAALAEENNEVIRQNRIAFAISHSWPASVEKLYDVIEKVNTNYKTSAYA